MHAHMQIHVHTRRYTYAHADICTHMQIYAHTRTHMQLYIPLAPRVVPYTHVRTQPRGSFTSPRVCTHAHHTYTDTHAARTSRAHPHTRCAPRTPTQTCAWLQHPCACMHARCAHVCAYAQWVYVVYVHLHSVHTCIPGNTLHVCTHAPRTHLHTHAHATSAHTCAHTLHAGTRMVTAHAYGAQPAHALAPICTYAHVEHACAHRTLRTRTGTSASHAACARGGCVYVYTQAHICTHRHIYVHTRTHTCTYTYTHAHICTHMHIYVLGTPETCTPQ